MFRAIGLAAILVLVIAVFAGCGGGDSTSATATPTTSTSATTSPHASATPATTSPHTSATPASAPATATGAASPGSAGSWAVSGALTGSAIMTGSGGRPGTACELVQNIEEVVTLSGTLNGKAFGISPNFTAGAASLDYGKGRSSGILTVTIFYGQAQADLQYWSSSAGGPGTSGTVSVQANGSGSMQVTVPISATAPGGATQPITVSGAWTCP